MHQYQFSPFWSISHDYAKFLDGHTKSTLRFPFDLQHKCLLVHFAWLCEIFAWSCEMEIHNFSTPFCHFFNFFLLNPPQPYPNQTLNLGPNQLHYLFHYAFESSTTLFVIFNLIHLFCHQFIKIIPWNDSKTS